MAGILRSLILCDRGEKDDVVIADHFLDNSEAEKNCQRKHLDQKKGDVMKKGLRLLFIIAAMVTFSMATSGWAANLINNGDFELGNSGFGTDFTFTDETWDGSPPSGLWDPLMYTTAPDASPYHPNAVSYGDHTSGEGNYMIVNGSTDLDVNTVWSQTVLLQSNLVAGLQSREPTVYKFSVWGSSWAEDDIPGIRHD